MVRVLSWGAGTGADNIRVYKTRWGRVVADGLLPWLDVVVNHNGEAATGDIIYHIHPLVTHTLALRMEVESITLMDMKRAVFQLLHALAFLHANGIVHGHVRPSACGWIAHAPNQLKLWDFRRACRTGTMRELPPYLHELRFCAPEIYTHFTRSAPAHAASDVFSVGVIILEALGCTVLRKLDETPDFLLKATYRLLGGRMFPEPTSIHTSYSSVGEGMGMSTRGKRFTLRSLVSSRDAVSLLQGMLAIDPASRCSAEQAMAHTFFDDVRTPTRPLILLPLQQRVDLSMSPRPDVHATLTQAIEQQFILSLP